MRKYLGFLLLITLIFLAGCSQETFTVKFNSDGGSSLSPIVFSAGENLELPIPTKTDYEFLGWFEDETLNTLFNPAIMPEGNVTLHAGWKYRVFEITYHLDGGHNHKRNPSTGRTNEAIHLEAPTKAYHEFSGWYIDSSFSQLVTSTNQSDAEALELFAKFEPEVYNVIFKDYDSQIISEQEVAFLESAIDPGPMERQYYDFLGWSSDITEITNPNHDDYVLIEPIYAINHDSLPVQPLLNQYETRFLIEDIFIKETNNQIFSDLANTLAIAFIQAIETDQIISIKVNQQVLSNEHFTVMGNEVHIPLIALENMENTNENIVVSEIAYQKDGAVGEVNVHYKATLIYLDDFEVYEIYTVDDFLDMPMNRYNLLMNDLDFKDVDFDHLTFDLFEGVFNGNNHTLSNITITLNPVEDGFIRLALFDSNVGTIMNLNFDQLSYQVITTQTFNPEHIQVSGIVDSNFGIIENINIYDSEMIINADSFIHAAGVSVVNSGSIRHVNNHMDITVLAAENFYYGALINTMDGNDININNIYLTGDIHVASNNHSISGFVLEAGVFAGPVNFYNIHSAVNINTDRLAYGLFRQFGGHLVNAYYNGTIENNGVLMEILDTHQYLIFENDEPSFYEYPSLVYNVYSESLRPYGYLNDYQDEASNKSIPNFLIEVHINQMSHHGDDVFDPETYFIHFHNIDDFLEFVKTAIPFIAQGQ